MNTKKIYIVHGWKGKPLGGWFNWAEEKLKKKGFEVFVLEMPEKNRPHLDAWVKFLQKEIKDVDSHTYFIGHSVGCQTILRFLDRLPKYSRVGGCVFVSGWFELKHDHYKLKEDEENRKRIKEWLERPMNLDKIKTHTKNILAIFSDNDHFVPLSNVEIFKNKLGAKTVIKKDKEHFNHVKEIKEVIGFFDNF